LDVLAFKRDVNTAIQRPRMHCQLIPDSVYVEDDFDAAVQNKLRSDGNLLVPAGSSLGSAVQAIVVEDDVLYAASDHRKMGQPFGY
jgi:gamma-glutamyltranspeptidase/glutathione hydrolase/leukotriene-C4 hydrolase